MILCAAVKFHMLDENLGDEHGDIVITGWRHANCFETMKDLGFCPADYKEVSQGFIDHFNNYLTREEALYHANQCGQLSSQIRWLKGKNQSDQLFSEDLY